MAGAPDPAVVRALRHALARGVLLDESRELRRSLLVSTLGGAAGLVGVALFMHFTGGGLGWNVAAAFVVLSLVTMGFRYRALAPRPPQEIGEKEVTALAGMYALCGSCGALMGRLSLGCGSCGALRRPRAAAVGVVLLAVATVAVLVGLWFKTGG